MFYKTPISVNDTILVGTELRCPEFGCMTFRLPAPVTRVTPTEITARGITFSRASGTAWGTSSRATPYTEKDDQTLEYSQYNELSNTINRIRVLHRSVGSCKIGHVGISVASKSLSEIERLYLQIQAQMRLVEPPTPYPRASGTQFSEKNKP